MSRSSCDWVNRPLEAKPSPNLSSVVQTTSLPRPAPQIPKYQSLPPKRQCPMTSSMQHDIQNANKNKNSNDATSADAIRIRDNQRRSRARRKEYQQELERRVQKFEQQGVHATIEVQTAARKVARENTLLRSLLRLKGITAGEIDEYLSNANGNENCGNVAVNGNRNGNADVNGSLDRNNDRYGTGIAFTQLQPAPSPLSTSASTSDPTSIPTAPAFPNTINQNQNECQNENQSPIQLDNYPSYYPAEQTTIQPTPQYVETPNAQNIPVSVSAPASITTSASSLYSPSASFTSSSLTPSANNDQQYQPQNSYTSFQSTIPYAAPRFPQGPPQQDHQQQQQQPSLQLPLQLRPPIPSTQPHPYRPSPSHSNSNCTHPIQPQPQLQDPQTLLHTTPTPQASCSSPTDTTLDSTSCEIAASIIASMRGHGDAASVRAELGCGPGGANCQVGNMEIFRVLDRSIGSCR
ncbi:bZIP1 superfamily domain-containing protein [Histoplasma capsulatum G186AR]|nr:bZIP1 superfamily domain-containing protein [Histoplasma capsulatum]QSS70832.1 bZIP1 superfamily domain-containing protein [Histoplasma capsulatum G186AR]